MTWHPQRTTTSINAKGRERAPTSRNRKISSSHATTSSASKLQHGRRLGRRVRQLRSRIRWRTIEETEKDQEKPEKVYFAYAHPTSQSRILKLLEIGLHGGSTISSLKCLAVRRYKCWPRLDTPMRRHGHRSKHSASVVGNPSSVWTDSDAGTRNAGQEYEQAIPHRSPSVKQRPRNLQNGSSIGKGQKQRIWTG